MVELVIISISLVIIFILIYGHTRIINLNRGNIYNEDKYIQSLYKKSNKLNVETELLVTMFEFLISAITVEVFLKIFEENITVINSNSVSFTIIKYLYILLFTVIATYITMIIGTYIPKHIVHKRKRHKFNDSVLMKLYGGIIYLFYPVTILSTYLDTIVKEKVYSENTDVEEIKEFTSKGLEKGSITKIEKEIIDKAVYVLDKPISKICTKAEDIISVKIDDSVDSIIKKVAKNNVSRALIYDKKKCLGYIHLKDLLLNKASIEKGTKDIQSIIKQPLVLSMDEKAQNCFQKMRNEKVKFAIVTDETDEIIGVVTTGDITYELMGKSSEL